METTTKTARARFDRLISQANCLSETVPIPVFRLLLLLVLLNGLPLPFATQAAESQTKPGEGLILTVRTASGSDVSVVQGVALHVPTGGSPSPFVQPGAFTAVWEGQLAVDLRGDFAFHAVSSGALKVEANGSPALELSEGKTERIAGKPVRLNKGPNPFKVTFTSPPRGDSTLRLYWSSDEIPTEPVQAGVFRFTSTPELEKASLIQQGRELFLDFRCVRCHAPENPSPEVRELQMDAPSFEGIGSRRDAQWMSQWMANPHALRASAKMPSMLRRAAAREEADSIAAYLSTLSTSGPKEVEPASPGPESLDSGKKHFEVFHCLACHDDPGSDRADSGKIPLKNVQAKFLPGALASFLRSPSEHYRWIRMPDFKLTVQESEHLAAFLLSRSPVKPSAAGPAPSLAANGKTLVQTKGCLNCHVHAPPIENRFNAPALSGIKTDSLQKGCLAPAADDSSKAPQFNFTAPQRTALAAFLSTDKGSLQRHVPAEFAKRQIRQLNCAECHGKFDGFPPLELLGEKLKPEWSRQFIAGEIAYKPRPWLESRMPAFKAWAEGLAAGLAHSHGFPEKTPIEGAIDSETTKIGQKLVSSEGGFSCISCHGVASMAPTQVFESAGINLAFSGERLQPEYYKRWLVNPLRIDPQTKMPVYFDQGKSPLTELLGGDAGKQVDAIWQYIRLGNKMPPPMPPPEEPQK